ncbi:MAG TPA: hypothetical protein VH208_04740, partial [Myxococcaceae bacterium]|nr:hypothetical protein [Myxococcaceae bacterium]
MGSRVAIGPLGRGTWLSDEEQDAVWLVGDKGETQRFEVGAWPEELVVSSDGRAFVACRQAGRIEVIDPRGVQTSVAVGTEPKALALDE